MSNYTKATNFASKDALTTGNPLKTLSGTELDDEFNNIATAVTTKANSSNAALTGVPTAPTAAANTSSTQVATTAFVTTEANLKADLAGAAFTGALTTTSTIDGVDIATRDAVLTSTTTTANAALPKAGGALTGPVTTNSTFDGVDIAARDGILTTTATVALEALPKAGGAMTGAITTNSTFDGRDVAADGTKLDTFTIGSTVQAYDADTTKNDVANTFTGQQTFKETADTVYVITDGANFEIAPANGNVQTITLGATRTALATNFAAGQSIVLGVDDGTAYALTWPTITWVISGGGGAAPTLATTGFTWVMLWKQGTTLFGGIVGSP